MVKNQKKLVESFIKQQGGVQAAADTIGVSKPSLWRWRFRAKLHPLTKANRAAIEAVLEHPEDYAEFPRNAKRRGRPKTIKG